MGKQAPQHNQTQQFPWPVLEVFSHWKKSNSKQNPLSVKEVKLFKVEYHFLIDHFNAL